MPQRKRIPRYSFDNDKFRIQLARWVGRRSLQEAGEECDVSQSTISRILNGNAPDLTTFVALMKAMGMPSLEQFIIDGGTDVDPSY